VENEGAREWIPLLLSNEQDTSSLGRHEYDGRSEVVNHVTGKLFPQGHDIVLEYHMAWQIWTVWRMF
jgi:hypothetical protein